jgi:predicted nucleic acid-binding protein
MTVFLDTSAIFAVMDADDGNHRKASKIWSQLLETDSQILVSNYVLVEAFALIQHRLGMKAVRIFQEDIMPVLTVEWVDEAVHSSGVASLLAAAQRKLSLVDCISFVIMRKVGIKEAFAFDRHFAAEGFRCLK